MLTQSVDKIAVGERYTEAIESRETEITVDGKDFIICENLWEDADDTFVTDHKWSLTTYLSVPENVISKEEILQYVINNVFIMRAVAFLEYELVSVEDEGVAIWKRPAPERDENE